MMTREAWKSGDEGGRGESKEVMKRVSLYAKTLIKHPACDASPGTRGDRRAREPRAPPRGARAERRAQRTRNTNARDPASRRAAPSRLRAVRVIVKTFAARATSDGERDGRPRERRGETSGTDAESRLASVAGKRRRPS